METERAAIDGNERTATITVMRGNVAVIINETDYAKSDILAPGSREPAGYVAPAPVADDGTGSGAPDKAGKGGGKTKQPEVPVTPAGGAPAPAYTVADPETGKFYRTDDKGVRLIAEAFDTAGLAAAAPLPVA